MSEKNLFSSLYLEYAQNVPDIFQGSYFTIQLEIYCLRWLLN